jgi:two-component system, OmpR family, phosphate regulon sensor histidine kinase PhoR
VTEAVMGDPAGGVAGRVFAFRDVSGERVVEQLKSDFVVSVSHELRAPLTSIYGFAETLLRREGLFRDDERQTFLRYIASESERLTGIVERLLNIARLESGDLAVSMDEVDVGAVLADAVRRAETLEHGDGHRFVLDLPEQPLAAEADREKLRQVLADLLENAVRYTPKGTSITVTARGVEDAVEVFVADEGAGIPPAEQPLIFRKFYRGSDPGGGATGAGLGLFIARGLVRAMGGDMWVASSEGRGSSFGFQLKAAGKGDG